MAQAEWGSDPEFFGPRHAHREERILGWLTTSETGGGVHLECAAGVGSLSAAIARRGRRVVAADASLRSLVYLQQHCGPGVMPVLADITQLPFRDQTFQGASTAETLEHIEDDRAAVAELARVLEPGGQLVGTVPAGPEQWSDWDDWAGHLRRYTTESMRELLESCGLKTRVTRWGWPVLRLYDEIFLMRVNRRRLQHSGPRESDEKLQTVAQLGKKRWLVRFVKAVFAVDRIFDGSPWGVGILFRATRRAVGYGTRKAR